MIVEHNESLESICVTHALQSAMFGQRSVYVTCLYSEINDIYIYIYKIRKIALIQIKTTHKATLNRETS